MKKNSTKRGLYVHKKQTPENAEESFQLFRELAGELERYVDDAERFAGKILGENGHDPATLWDIVETPNGCAKRIALIDRDALGTEVAQALAVIEYARNIRIAGDLENENVRDAIWRALHLAQATEHLNANLAWKRPVKAREKSDKNLRREKCVTDDQIREVRRTHPNQKKQAEKLGISVRQLQRRLKKL